MSAPRPWRECAYCGARTRHLVCSNYCHNRHYALQQLESGRRTRAADAPHQATSEWEDAQRERRLRVMRRAMEEGELSPGEAADEAGFTSDEADAAYRAAWVRRDAERRAQP